MEKRIFLAIILSFLLLMLWGRFFGPQPEEQPKDPDKQEQTDPKPGETGRKPDETGGDPAKTPDDQEPGKPGPAITAGIQRTDTPPAASEVVVLENGALRVELDTKGALARSVRLLEFSETPGSKERLELIRAYTGEDARHALALGDPDHEGWLEGQVWNTAGKSADGKSITFTLRARDPQGEFEVTKKIAIIDGKNRMSVEVTLRAVDAPRGVAKNLWLTASGGVFPADRVDKAVPHAVIGLEEDGELVVDDIVAAELLKEGNPQKISNEAVRFVCDLGVYFGAYLHPMTDGVIRGARIHAIGGDRDDVEKMGGLRTSSELQFHLDAAGAEPVVASFDWYLGPKDFKAIRKNFDGALREDYLEVANFELTQQSMCCSLGPLEAVVNAIARFVLWVIGVFNGMVGNVGVSIIMLTVCVKLILFPINRKSQVAMHKHQKAMAKIKPKLEALKEKYKNDRNKFAQEQMKLFKQEKVQVLPLGGCLPLFLQMPIFFGLISAIRFGIDLRHASFLWCEDLSMPDKLIAFAEPWAPSFLSCCPAPIVFDGLNVFPIAMTAAWFINQKMMPRSPDPQMAQQQKMMLFMPILFGVMMYGFAAGLSLYWLVSSLIGIFEQRVIKKMFPVDGAEENKDGGAPAKA